MREELQKRCDHFIAARDVIRDTFKWNSTYMPPVCANLFCAAGQMPDQDRLRACRDLINRNTGIFSSFRGEIRVPLSCLLSMEDRPEEKFEQVQQVYQMLREQFFASDYLALAAFLIRCSAISRYRERTSSTALPLLVFRFSPMLLTPSRTPMSSMHG